MKKICTSICFLMLIAMGKAQIAIINSTPSAYSGNVVIGNKSNNATEAIYLASEIGNANFTTATAAISRIEFNLMSVSPHALPIIVTDSFSIYLKNVSATSKIFVTDSTSYSGYTKVYDGSLSIIAYGWNGINLTTPFVRTDSSNLQILIVRNNNDSTVAGAYFTCSTGNADNTATSQYSSRRYSGVSKFLEKNTNLTASSYRPAIKLLSSNTEYLREGFEPAAGCNLSTIIPTSFFGSYFNGISGSWYSSGVYRSSGSAGVCPSLYGPNHVRFGNIAGSIDSGYIVTPVVSLGIKELHLSITRQMRAFSIWATNDTLATTTNWTIVTKILPSFSICADTTIIINSATAKRLKIVASPGVDSDLDSIWVTKFNTNTISLFPTLQGNIFLDHNSNSIKDTLEPYKSNVKVQLSNGNYTFTDNNGFYQIPADSIGACTLTVTAPNLYSAVPQTINYNFSSWDTVVTKDIALQPTVVKDSVAINVIPMVMNAVQGAAMPYWVQYNNAGTTVLSPIVNLTYNNYLLGYDSCTDANAAPTANGIVTGELNMQPGKQNNLISYFTIKPSANIGDTLRTVYNISTTNISQTDSFYMIIEGGVAASDGQRATPSLTDAQVAAGKDIIYTIGFKNTGNDTAYNVVITDTLSSLLKANTLQMIASSNTCKTTVKGNVVTFELLNIKLPKASSNAAKSIGFVSFKIKPQSNLTAGTIITNKANTYYNYRTPQSSTAATIIKAVVTPLRMMSYELRMMNDKTIENKWQTANEVNVSHFNIQRSINNKDFINIGKISANNNALNEYRYTDDGQLSTVAGKLYYRIESIDIDGRKQYSEIRNIELGIRNGGISIYPNPAKDIVIVECKGMKQVSIFNCLGLEIFRQEPNNNATVLNVQELAKGLYLVKVITANGATVLDKFIKQ